jgi:DNA (cytosine-5)-methyltransferase 1
MGPNPHKGLSEWDRKFSKPKLVRIPNGVSAELDRIKGLGNAIVPQVVFEIFKAIEKTQEIVWSYEKK